MNNIQLQIMMQSLNNGNFEDDLSDLIKDYSKETSDYKKYWDEYAGDVPIKTEKTAEANKANNILVNHWRKFIVDEYVGYGYGKPIAYQVNQENYTEADYKKIIDEIRKFNTRNNIERLDKETANYQSACGVSYRLLYIDKLGKEKIMNLAPWEVIYIEDKTIDEVQLAIVFYPMEYKDSKGKTVYKTRAEVYDKTYITYYIEEKDGFVIDVSEPVNPQPHMFDYVPIVRFRNNTLNKSDFADVVSLIDAYDMTVSMSHDEFESFRMSLLKILGGNTLMDEDLQKFLKANIISLPEKSEVGFLTKQVQTDFLENLKKTLERNILRFSHLVDFTDDAFSGSSVSGESRKWKLINLDNATNSKQIEFKTGLRDMYKVLCSAWSKRGINLDYEDIQISFTKSTPDDIIINADTVSKLNGIISKKTLYSVIPFIEDADAELAQYNKEQLEGGINLDDLMFETTGSVA